MPLSIATFPGASGGSYLDHAKNQIPDNGAYIIQDAFCSQIDPVVLRGPVKAESGAPNIAYTPWGVVTVTDPSGNNRIGVLHGHSEGTSTFSVLSDDMTDWEVEIDLEIDPDNWPPIIATSPAAGGIMIGWSGSYGVTDPTNQGILYWGGGNKDDYTTGVTVQRELTDMTGSGFTANVSPGMWIFDGDLCIGQVRSIQSNTELSLVGGSLETLSGDSVTFSSLRGTTNTPNIMTGRITSSDNTDRVQGGDTKFKKQLADDGEWNIFRWWDFNFDGVVGSIASDIGLTYEDTSAHDNFDEEYCAIWFDSGFDYEFDDITPYGWIPTEYAGRHWYANLGQNISQSHQVPLSLSKTYRLWFTHPQNPEAIDTTSDGDWFDIRSSSTDNKPIRGLAPTHNSMLVYKEDETFAVFGSSPDSFNVQRVHDDGLWSPMTIQPYKEGVLWAGKRGIYYYDGASITNLLDEKAAFAWRKGLVNKDPDSDHMWSMLDRQHYFVHFVWDSPIELIRNQDSESPDEWTLCFNLETGAVTFASNLLFRGAVNLPASVGQRVLYAVPTSATTVGKLCNSSDLFDTDGVDTVTSYGSEGTATPGPSFFLESKAFDMGDPIRLKRFRQLTFYYLSEGGVLNIDAVLGLNTEGTLLDKALTDSEGLWQALRNRFGKKDQLFSFRIYQNDDTLERFKLGSYQIEFKPERAERVIV